MFFTQRRARLSLVAASLALGACSDGFGVHKLVLKEGETEGFGGCTLLTDDGSKFAGADLQALDSDDDFRQVQESGDGKASYQFYIRSEPGQQEAQPLGELALEILLDDGSFGPGSARVDSFETRAGVRRNVYTWGQADCETTFDAPPAWVLEKVAAQ